MRGRDIGVDEAGRGSVIGPLVVCAIAVPEEDRGILVDIGADDSKKLSKKKRGAVVSEIDKLSDSRGWGVGEIVCSPSRIDLGMMTGNLNSLEVELFAEAINAAMEPNGNCRIILDACDVNAPRFGENVGSGLGERWGGCRILSEHGMDGKDVVVGAASTIAKFRRDAEVAKLTSDIGIELGSGYPSDPVTRDAVRELSTGRLPHECLRWSWATVSDIWTETHRRPVPTRDAGATHPVQTPLEDWNQ
ncbi:MAG: ribonuclease HII [Candidatus Thalassarchaeaceae archaeon]|jgi:ribonuclease HII|nr:ribonuclease HII [Euryarchaeota archaeon]MDP7092275.1 ribonuclease HII [Candidatus Thalassarchaeaceae archaeon]MBV43338.1 ribonuclease HII [Euryarchaeota archaeon]MDP7257499.1 ribonuclease HII [Candidatus Thalassarchaeaceae archaeon]MDP7446506.1 ribonuclease HII [Candidatus Thalassarchaeaceae archaeon]|tara:strand:+ start:12914 stop:13654 length:741 start_codon:yes stop_codon:yes gene_type:complete